MLDEFSTSTPKLLSSSPNPEKEIPPHHPLPLLSSYTHASYEAELASAHHPLEWLTRIAHSHPDRVAHEIYTAEALRGHDRDEEGETEGETCKGLEPSHVLTYGELNRRANAVAKWLLSSTFYRPSPKNGKIDQGRVVIGEKGVRGEKICVCMEREAAFYVIMAAIWKAGGVYCSVRHLFLPTMWVSHGVEILFRSILHFRLRGRGTLFRIVARSWYSCTRFRSVTFFSMIFPPISKASHDRKGSS